MPFLRMPFGVGVFVGEAEDGNELVDVMTGGDGIVIIRKWEEYVVS